MSYFLLAIREVVRAISHQFWAFIGTTLTVFLAMLVAGSFAIFTKNMGFALDKFRAEAALELYLESDIDSLQKETIQNQLVANKYILKINFISKDKALFRLRETFGQEMVAGLKTNPLPESYEITLEPEVYDEDKFKELVDSLYKLPGIEDIGYIPSVITKLKDFFKAAAILGVVLGLLVILATGFIVGNTIHVRIAERRQTFYIMRLVGAGNGFIYAPYLMFGTLIGLLGSLLSILILWFSMINFSAHVIQICFLSPIETACFILAGSIVGFTGSYIALKKFLDV